MSHPDGPGFIRVTLSGELDLATAPQLADALADPPDGTVVVIVDLRELTFMDSTGQHAILSARARLAGAGCRLVLVSGSEQVQRIFEITSTRHHLEFISPTNPRDPAIVRSRTEACLEGHLSRPQMAGDVTLGADDPSEPAPGERRSTTHPPLNSEAVASDRSEHPLEGRAPESQSTVERAIAVPLHARSAR